MEIQTTLSSYAVRRSPYRAGGRSATLNTEEAKEGGPHPKIETVNVDSRTENEDGMVGTCLGGYG